MTDLFPAISLDEQIATVEREIRMRIQVYDRRVGAGKMTRSVADREIAAMRAVLNTVTQARDLRQVEAAEPNG